MRNPVLQHRWTPLSGTPGPPVLGIVDPRSTCPRTGGPPVHPGGPRGSTYSRMSGPPPEQVDPKVMDHLLGARMDGQLVL